ncbi:MAG: hypothetical protein AAFP17_12320 [Pseudomonadota bacterium]
MSSASASGDMPSARDFGWRLREKSASHFDISQRDNGQFTVVLNHPLLRSVSAEMLSWWFRTFTTLRVTLEDVPGYVGERVPGYMLWHPVDHLSATLIGRTSADGSPLPGRTQIHIREAMQYGVFGQRFPVDAKLTVYYAGPDGWAMGKRLPLLGPAMMLRIHFRNVFDEGKRVGVHYHYEVVIGVSGRDPISRLINRRLTAAYGPDFFAAWQTHNVEEVGTFENFLAPLFAQAERGEPLRFSRRMDAAPPDALDSGYDEALFQRRVETLKGAGDPYAVQAYDQGSFL